MNAMGSLSILSPDRVLPQLISTITASVQNPALYLVTREEFSIMQTPAGELFDKSIIQSAQQDSIKKANMKRENKAYSFKEQIIEMELKEEIKKKKGIKEEVQLTSKQKEMLQAQMDKEAQIRRRLQEVRGCHVPCATLLCGEDALQPTLLFAVLVDPTNHSLLALLAAGWGTRGGTWTTRCHHDQEPAWPDSVHPCSG